MFFIEPYNVKVITYPDLTRQYRVYEHDVVYKGYYRKDRVKDPFNDQWTKTLELDIDKHFEHISEVSMKRTKSKVYNYARCNDWDWFVTFTFSAEKVNRYDYDHCVNKLNIWLKTLRRTADCLSYIVVPERHKDGAWHFHGLFSGLNEKQIKWTGKYVIKRVRTLGRSKYVRTKEKIYKFGSYKLGWMTATKVRQKDRVTSYICKYITKELCDSSYGRKRYWCSRNLLLPVEEVYNMDIWDRTVLANDLEDSAKFHKNSVVQYGDMAQCVKLYEIDCD